MELENYETEIADCIDIEQWKYISGVGVSDGRRLTISNDDAEQYGISEGDIIVLAVVLNPGDHYDGHRHILVGERPVGTERRISVPTTVADAHALCEHDRVGIAFIDTDLEVGSGDSAE